MDDWDSVINLEANSYQQGLQDGISVAAGSGQYEEGNRAGMLKGFAIGFEAGFFQTAAELHLKRKEGEEGSSTNREKMILTLQELQSHAAAVPMNNDPDFDFDEKLLAMRGLYKKAGNSLGKFPPENKVTSAPSTQDW
jgi:hypothetical protein